MQLSTCSKVKIIDCFFRLPLVHLLVVSPGSHTAPDVCLCLASGPVLQRAALWEGGGAGEVGDGAGSRPADAERENASPSQTKGKGK